MRQDMEASLLSNFDKILLEEERMGLYLECDRLDLAEAEQVSEKLTIEVGNSQMFGIALLDTNLKLLPALLQRPVHPFLALGVHVGGRPVQIVDIYIVQFHQP